MNRSKRNTVTIRIETVGPPPAYATSGSAGMDLRAHLGRTVTIAPGKRKRVPTGIRVSIPAGYEAQVRPRSGLADRNGVTVLNTPGTIDADYRGEVQVILINLGEKCFTVRDGDRIAQLVVTPVCRVKWASGRVGATKRGSGGFGHTGRR